MESPPNTTSEVKPKEENADDKIPKELLNDKFYCKTFQLSLELKKNLVLLEKASKDKDFKSTATISKNLKKLRKMFDLPDAVLALSFYLPDLHMRIMLPTQPTEPPSDKDLETFLHCTQQRSEEIMMHAET
jgi:hypothetical protein